MKETNRAKLAAGIEAACVALERQKERLRLRNDGPIPGDIFVSGRWPDAMLVVRYHMDDHDTVLVVPVVDFISEEDHLGYLDLSRWLGLAWADCGHAEWVDRSSCDPALRVDYLSDVGMTVVRSNLFRLSRGIFDKAH